MNRRERFRRCYSNQEVDRPGVYSRTGFPHDDQTYDGVREYLQQHSELKSAWAGCQESFQIPTDSTEEAFSEDYERRVTTLHTPAGDLQSSKLASLKGQPGMIESYFLKTADDAKKYLSLPIPEACGDVSGFFEADREMGDRGIVEVAMGSNPGGWVAGHLFGSENFAIMSLTDREILHTLCERHMRIQIDRLKYLISRGVGPYFCMLGEEYICPPLHGPKDFYDFNVKYDKPIIDVIHEAGGRIHIHCHGSVKDVFQGFIDMGADVVHPFEAPPMGDITPAEAKALSRGKLCLEGNIQIGDMYQLSPDEIEEETRKLIRCAFDDRRGLIVCPTASPYIRGGGEACSEQYKRMVDTVLSYNPKG